ncbi:MAG: hypothetical protein ACK4RK_13035 [Gemmataceae bacterium]
MHGPPSRHDATARHFLIRQAANVISASHRPTQTLDAHAEEAKKRIISF